MTRKNAHASNCLMEDDTREMLLSGQVADAGNEAAAGRARER